MDKADGDAGARRAAGVIAAALCAESSPASLNEDYAKVDLKFSFRSAFDRNQLISSHCQVKSGKSYQCRSSTTENIKLNIDKITIKSLSGSSGIISWVPPKPDKKIYWVAVDPRKKTKLPLSLPSHQYIRPSIKFDWSRLHEYSRWNSGLAKQNVSSIVNEVEIHRRAKQFYKDLKSSSWEHPLVGNLSVSRFAWRHVTRRSKSKQRRTFSLRIVPYLKSFINKTPDRFVIRAPIFRCEGERTVETRYLLCWYRKALNIENKSYALLLRIKEEISYPANWGEYPLGEQDIKQQATLASWWAKIEK